MLNHTLMTFDDLGRIRCTLEAADVNAQFNGGTPIKDGLVCLTAVDAEIFLSGLGYIDIGNICSDQVGTGLGSPLADATGRIKATTNEPAFWYCGLPFGSNSRLSIVIVSGMPIAEYAFSSAFNNGFDSPTAP